MIYLSRLAIVLITLFILSGCASVSESRTNSISVDTPGCPEALCTLENDDGKYYIKETPDTVTVEQAYGDLSITCEKDGKTSVMQVEPKAKDVWGNILHDSIIGRRVDATTGAGYEYPRFIIHPLEC